LLSEDGTIERIKDSMTNVSYKIMWNGRPYVLRFSGKSTEQYIDRDREIFYTEEACRVGISPVSTFYNGGQVKLTEFIEGARTFEFERDDFMRVLKLFDTYFTAKHGKVRCLRTEIENYESLYGMVELPEGYHLIRDKVLAYAYKFGKQNLAPTHGDIAPVNILVSATGEYSLIDFEYAGLFSKYWDWGNLACEMEEFQGVDRERVFDKILEHNPSVDRDQLRAWSYLIDFVWTCWGLMKEGCGEKYLAYDVSRFKKAFDYWGKGGHEGLG